MSTKKQTYFNKEWFQDPDFKLWLQEVPTSRTKAKCKLCQKAIELSNMVTFALKSHVSYKKHKDLVENKKTSGSFFERKRPISFSDKHASGMNGMDSYVAK